MQNVIWLLYYCNYNLKSYHHSVNIIIIHTFTSLTHCKLMVYNIIIMITQLLGVIIELGVQDRSIVRRGLWFPVQKDIIWQQQKCKLFANVWTKALQVACSISLIHILYSHCWGDCCSIWWVVLQLDLWVLIQSIICTAADIDTYLRCLNAHSYIYSQIGHAREY